ncbi:MAG: recombinase family protein [Clostridia bacterium]|nr:recombinase family protein [Clostridia bacterium]
MSCSDISVGQDASERQPSIRRSSAPLLSDSQPLELQTAYAALYVRLSRDENGEKSDSIETQKNLLMSFSKEMYPQKPVKIYIDDNVSGVIFDRPALNRLRADAKHGIADILILKDLSRLGRSNAKTLLFIEEIELLGVRIVTTDGRYDSEKNFELAGIDSWFNERYVMDISRKIRSNIKQKIESGQYIGTAPYGYRKKVDCLNVLEPDPETAPIVRRIFDLYINGYGYKKIAGILDSDGILPPAPSRSKFLCWNPVTVKRILSNRVYVGTTVQGISRKISFKSKKTCRLPSDMWHVTDGTHEPLIPAAVFEQAAGIRESRRRAGGSPSESCRAGSGVCASLPYRFTSSKTPLPVNVFRGIIRCGYCGGPMIQRLSQGRPAAYICARYAKHGAGACRRNGIHRDFLLKTVSSDLLKILKEQSDIAADDNSRTNSVTEKMIKRDQPAGEIDRISEVHPICEDIHQAEIIKRKQESVYNDFLEGRISEDLFDRMNKIFEQKLSGGVSASGNGISARNDELKCGVNSCGKDSFAVGKILEHMVRLTEIIADCGFDGFEEFFSGGFYCESLDSFNQKMFACMVGIGVCEVKVFDDEAIISYRYKPG